MRQRFLSILIIVTVVACSGCTTFLEGDYFSESKHDTIPYIDPPDERIEVSNYDELKAEMLGLIMGYEDSGSMYTNNYDGDVDADIELASDEIMSIHPVGAFMVSNITGVVTRIVTYYEIEITFEYKRTKQQLDEMINVATLRYLRTELLSAMGDYREEVIFRTSLNISESDFIEYVKEAYYQNPRRIVMLPVTAVETFPRTGSDRIFELSFSNTGKVNIMLGYGAALTSSVRRNAQRAVGDTDAEILLSMANNLIASTSFDEGAAQAISEHGTQNFAATAYGALVLGNAVGEGFAMAFKAMCDELEFDCQVVLGFLDGMVHAWNIIYLYGDYYHIDVAMGAANGIETAFLKTDLVLLESYYTWDFANTVKCQGLLTYVDVAGVEDPVDPDDPDNPENPEDPDNPGDAGASNMNGNPEDQDDGSRDDPDSRLEGTEQPTQSPGENQADPPEEDSDETG